MALPIGWYVLRRRGGGALLDWRIYSVALCAVVPALMWYGYAMTVSRDLPTQQMLAVGDHRNFFSVSHYLSWLDADCWERMIKCVLAFVVPSLPALALFFYGVVVAPRDDAFHFLRLWLLAVVAYFFVDVYPIAVVVHEYYYLNIVPLTAFFLAYGVVHIVRTEWSSCVKVLGREGHEWKLQIRIPQGILAWLKLAMLVGAVMWFPLASLAGSRAHASHDWHSAYYAIARKPATMCRTASRSR